MEQERGCSRPTVALIQERVDGVSIIREKPTIAIRLGAIGKGNVMQSEGGRARARNLKTLATAHTQKEMRKKKVLKKIGTGLE